MNRRQFVALAAAAAAVGEAAPKLAIDGGPAVRDKPLRAGTYGTSYYDDKELAELHDVIESRSPFRWSPESRKVAAFEKELAARMQTRYALAVTSGSGALMTAVAALGVGPGDEVILPAWTWYSCYNAIVLAGALPVFAEIDESFNIDVRDLEKKITPQTKAVLVAHLEGNPCDMDAVMAVARRHKLKVLEDAAQALGASYKGRPLGSIGDIGIYSMQVFKTITSGEGGAVVTNDPELFERASRFHDLGSLRAPHREWVGPSEMEGFAGAQFRMSEFTGGVLLAQLRKLDTIVGDVRRNASRVYEGIGDLPGIALRKLPDPQGELGSAIYLDFGTNQRRDQFVRAMKAENVPAGSPSGSKVLPTEPYIEQKLTVHPAWPSFTSLRGKAIRYGAASCPQTLDILGRFGGVRLHPKYTRQDTDDIVAALRKVYPSVSA
jgi:8-amino-3,8-dideoxy-alpha-D-manno-octulosonate transaminase